MVAWLLAIHVFGFVLWASGLIAATIMLSRQAGEISTEARQAFVQAQKKALRSMADPGALVTLLAGFALVATNSPYFLRAQWLHIKLLLVVILIGLHVMIAVRAKAVASGRATLERGQASNLLIFVLLVLFSILIAALPGKDFLT